MATATPNTSQIPAPRVPLIDERTGLVSQQWFRWFNNIYALTGSGAGITPVTNGGTGTGNIPTNGQLLIGNGTDYSLSVLTAGSNITITNTAGHITIASAGALSSFSAGTTGFTPSTPTTGAITLAGTLIAANGGTGYANYAVGDLLYANTTTTFAKLADVATGNALISGGVSTAPSWGKIGLTTHVSGTLPIANGGTNATATPTAGAVAYGTGAAYDFTAVGTSGQVLTSAGAGAPTWTSLTSAPITKTADFTVGAGETWFINNKTGSTCTVTLPTASTNTGRELTFKNYQAQTLVSASSNVVGLAGGAAATAILAASIGDWATLVSDGTNWIIMQAAANNCLLLE